MAIFVQKCVFCSKNDIFKLFFAIFMQIVCQKMPFFNPFFAQKIAGDRPQSARVSGPPIHVYLPSQPKK
jgi:hypothetical protein